ncbi:unnamed protein product [Effrenium voratum]|uniref:WWE domain-containing protein n=1 Tax=Effrenium voratum TaxID=2562239 RepID=A0AA36INJ6_9DINO|nr:unnamed protein product [Effrenium voratum]
MGCGGSAEKYEASFLQVTDTSASLKEPGSKPTIAPAVVAGAADLESCVLARWTAPAAPAEVALAPAAEEASTRPPVERNAPKGAWLVETAPETWEELPADVGATLTAALHANQPVALYTVHGAKPSQDVSYDVDFRQLLRRDRGSGRQQRLRWDPTWAPRLGAAGAISAADPGGAATRYQWELKNGTWADFEDEELQHLVRAWMMGHDQVRYRARGLEYEIQFPRMVQINLCTGLKRHIRVKPLAEPSLAPPAPTAAPAPAAAKAAAKTAAASRRAVRDKRHSLGPQELGADQPGDARGQGADCQPKAEALELPPGVSWPLKPEARMPAAEMYEDMCRGASGAQAERRSRYKALCLKWHPDKNLDSEDTATEVFQFLQLLRDWYLA